MGRGKFTLGSDGEIHEVKETDGRKSKEGLYPSFRKTFVRIATVLVLLGVGVFAGILLSRSGIMGSPAPTPTPISTNTIVPVILHTNQPPTPMPTLTETIAPTVLPTSQVLTSTPVPTNPVVTTLLPTLQLSEAPPQNTLPSFMAGELIIGLSDGSMFSYTADGGLRSLSLRGYDVAASPDRKSLAFIDVDTRIVIYTNGKQTILNSFGNHRAPVWGPGGKALAYMAQGADGHGNTGDFVYWLQMTRSFATDAARYLGFSAKISAAPISDPVTGKLLVIANTRLKVSTFFLLDPLCGCNDPSAWGELAEIPYNVSWATYNSTGTQIIFSADDGNLYVMDTATKIVTAFLVDATQKYRPMLDSSDKLLTYFDDAKHVYIMTLPDKTVKTITLPDDVDSLTWSGGK